MTIIVAVFLTPWKPVASYRQVKAGNSQTYYPISIHFIMNMAARFSSTQSSTQVPKSNETYALSWGKIFWVSGQLPKEVLKHWILKVCKPLSLLSC